MESTDILDGAKMKQQSALNSIILSDENEELRELSNAFLTISENEETKGDTADAFRQQMLDYKNLVDSAISANGYDITDNNTAYYSFIEYYFDGAVILQNKKDAEDEKSRDEGSRDYHYREYQDSFDSILGIFTAPYHYTAYLYYCACVSSDQSEIEYWEEIIRIFDEIKSTTSGLFTNSTSVRDAVRSGLIDLCDNFSDGNYNVDMNADWRLSLSDAFLNVLKDRLGIDDSGVGTFDSEALFNEMNRCPNMSDTEYQAFIDSLSSIGIVVDSDCKPGDIKTEVEEYLFSLVEADYYNTGNFAFNLDTRELYVLLYEDSHPGVNEQMASINTIFEEANYLGWEDDMTNIKFLTYTAPEPYRSVYLNYASNITEGDINYTGWSHASGGAFYIDHTKFNINDASTYKTFFHETSHCIDYWIGNGTAITSTYTADGLSLNDVLENDVRAKINEKINAWLSQGEYKYLSDSEKLLIMAAVEDCIMNQVDYRSYGTPDFYAIMDAQGYPEYTIYVDNCYDYVRTSITSEIGGCVSDNYGGFTGNTLMSGSHHEALQRSDGAYRVYWINGDIQSDGTNLYITLDDGTIIYETIDFTDTTQRPNSTLDESVIMSDANVTYKDSLASEFFAENMEAYMSRNSTMIDQLNYFQTDTNVYFVDLLNAQVN